MADSRMIRQIAAALSQVRTDPDAAVELLQRSLRELEIAADRVSVRSVAPPPNACPCCGRPF